MLRPLPQWRFLLIISIVMINSLQAGMLSGWTSPVLVNLQSDNSTISVSSDEGAWIVSVMPLVSLLCTPFAALTLQYFGRKIGVLIAVIPSLIFWIMVSFATTTTELLIARGISGMCIAYGMTAPPVYLGEISPENKRGAIGIGLNVFMNLGTLWIYWIGTYPDFWISSLSCALPIILVFIFYKWLPESPYYLVQKHKIEEAKEAIKKLGNTEKVNEEIEKIESTILTDSKRNPFIELFAEACHRRALFISIGTFTFAQLTGGITFIFYAHIIFQKAGNVSTNLMSLIKASLQVISSIGAAYVVDSVGRKPLLIISSIGSAIFMFCEGIYFYLQDNDYNVDNIWWLPLVSMILFNISQVIGLQPISLAYLGELFHPRVKSIAVCVSKSYLSFCVFIVSKLFQIMSDGLGNYVPFFIFSGIGVIGVFFVIFCVPETKGKTLEEVQYYMKHKTYEKPKL